jgi:hypothetical protein
MPYHIETRKRGGKKTYVVVNTETGEPKNKKPLTKDEALAFLRALYVNVVKPEENKSMREPKAYRPDIHGYVDWLHDVQALEVQKGLKITQPGLKDWLELREKFNPNHNPHSGQFASGSGGAGHGEGHTDDLLHGASALRSPLGEQYQQHLDTSKPEVMDEDLSSVHRDRAELVGRQRQEVTRTAAHDPGALAALAERHHAERESQQAEHAMHQRQIQRQDVHTVNEVHQDEFHYLAGQQESQRAALAERQQTEHVRAVGGWRPLSKPKPEDLQQRHNQENAQLVQRHVGEQAAQDTMHQQDHAALARIHAARTTSQRADYEQSIAHLNPSKG